MEFIFTDGILMPYKRGCLEPFERAPSDVRDSKYSFEGDLPVRRIQPRGHYRPKNLAESLRDKFEDVNPDAFNELMWGLDVLQGRTRAAVLEVNLINIYEKHIRGSYRGLFRKSKRDPEFLETFGQHQKDTGRRNEPLSICQRLSHMLMEYRTCPLIDNITL